MPFESAGLFNLPTPLAQQQITAQVFVSPAATLGHTMGINSTGGDPFDTSHVSQMLKQTSTPQHSSGMLSGFGLGGVNVSQQPSAIRADSTGNDSFFGSASVFDSRSTVGMTSNVSPGQLGSGTDSSLNHAWSESKFQSELFGAMASSPMILTPLKPTGTSSPSPQPTQPQYQKPPASVEEGLGVLCDIHNLDLSTRPSAGPAAKVDPFSSLKNPPKPTINELLKGGQTIDVNPPRMFDLGFPQLSNMPPPMHQSASTPVFTVGSPPISNPFAQQPNGISTPVTSQGVNSWNSTVNNGWMATTTIQQPIGYQMSMGFNGDLAAPPVAPRSSGRSAALPPPIQATNFLSGSAQKSQISCGNGSQASNPFADDFFK